MFVLAIKGSAELKKDQRVWVLLTQRKPPRASVAVEGRVINNGQAVEVCGSSIDYKRPVGNVDFLLAGDHFSGAEKFMAAMSRNLERTMELHHELEVARAEARVVPRLLDKIQLQVAHSIAETAPTEPLAAAKVGRNWLGRKR